MEIKQNKILTYIIQWISAIIFLYFSMKIWNWFLLKGKNKYIFLMFLTEGFGQLCLAFSSFQSKNPKLRYFEKNFFGTLAWLIFGITSISRICLGTFFLFSLLPTIEYSLRNMFSFYYRNIIDIIGISLFVIYFTLFLINYRRLNIYNAAFHILPSTFYLMVTSFFYDIIEIDNHYKGFYFLLSLSQLFYNLQLIIGPKYLAAYKLEIINIFIWSFLFFIVEALQ